jgi:squalene-associated FAD-dependent desaturase
LLWPAVSIPAASPPADHDVLVVGAGVSGLVCAATLAWEGLRVHVVEAGETLGGRAASTVDTVTSDAVDIGPHVLVTEYRNLLSVLERLGTAHLIDWQRHPLLTLLDRGRRRPLETIHWPAPLHGLPDLPQLLRAVSLSDVLSNSRVALRAARLGDPDVLALDDLAALTDLRRQGVSPRFIDWFWRSVAMTVLNVPLEQCSAASLTRVFRFMSGRSGYAFGFPTVGLSTLFAPGCVSAISVAGGTVRTQSHVRELRMDGTRCVGVELDDGHSVAAGRTVLALPPASLAQLWPWRTLRSNADAAHCAERESRRAQAFGALPPSPYASTMIWFDRPLRIGARFWARTWSPTNFNTDFYDLAAIRGHAAEAPTIVAANAIHAHQASAMSDRAIVRRTHEELSEFAPQARQARMVHSRVHRIPMAIPCPVPGFETLRPSAATPFPGLWLAGDWTQTGLPCSMESAARSGLLAAESVLHSLGRSVKLAQPVPELAGLVGWTNRHWPLRANPRDEP